MENQEISFDLCIIGAGIAGTYLASLLMHKNLKIAIVEEHEKIGLPLQCAGIVSQKIKVLVDFPDELILNRVNYAKLVSPTGTIIKLSGDERPYIIDRVGLDQYFYNKIKESDHIHVYLQEKFQNFLYNENDKDQTLLVKTNKRTIRTKLLIGADGPLSKVANLVNQKNHIIYASQARVKANFPENEASMYFNPKWKELFAWIVPEGNKIYRIGLASSKGVALNFRTFTRILNIKNEDVIDRQGGIIPIGMMNDVAFNKVMLLGDAAGQVKATTGGGIVMLLTAAKYAAFCISKAFEKQNFSQEFLQKFYEIPCKSTLGRELKIHFLIRLFLEYLNSREYNLLFQIIKSNQIEKIITFYGDMDFPRKLIIKLLGNNYFLNFILRILLKNPLIIIKIFKILLR